MGLLGSMADAAAVGAVIGAGLALARNREEELAKWTALGMVVGAGLGLLSAVLTALL